MRTVHASIAFVSLATLIASCTDEEVSTTYVDASALPGPDAGTGGSPTVGDSGSPGPVADAATPTPDADLAPVCEPGGAGELVVEVNGLPVGLDAATSLQGPAVGDAGARTLTESDTFANSASGDYEANTQNVVGMDPLVRPLFSPAAPRQLFCLADDDSHTLTVNYQEVATSHRLWALNNVTGAALLSFSSAALTNSTMPDAGSDGAIPTDAVAGTDLAFDRDGHLWTFGPTTEDPSLVRYRAAQFASAAAPGPDRSLDVNDVACLPAMRAMAFDGTGNLWLSTCGGQVVRLSNAVLETGNAVRHAVDADVVISGLSVSNEDLAFDAAGNLWVADEGKIVRFNADRLIASDSDAPDLTLTVRDSNDAGDLLVDYLTFDADGNLWGTDFAGNTLAHIDASDLQGDGDATVVADVSLVISVGALLNRPAIDDAGGLWISGAGQLIGFDAATLLLSSDTGSPTAPDVILAGSDIGAIGNVAFFPAAAGLPLYHSYP